MTVATQTRSLASLARALRAAQVVLVPVDPSEKPPVTADPTDMLHALCTSGGARALVTRAAARWAISAPEPLEPREGFAVLPVPMPRNLVGGRYAAVALLGEALRSETIDQLAHAARADARLARTLLSPSACWTRAALPALASLIASLAKSEGERLAGEEASARLGAAWEELHLLHSLSGDMTVGSAPRVFVTRALGELRATLGCRWTALRITGAAEPLFDMSLGGVFSDGIGALDARRVMFESQAPAQAVVASDDLVLAPIRRDGQVLGLLAAGGGLDGGNAMSNWERTLVETAAGHLAVFFDNARLYRDLDGMFMGALSALVSAIDAKDPYTRGHSQRVAMLSREIARKAGLSEDEAKNIFISGLVHDVGKIGVPESILRKQARLTDDEFAIVKQHPEIGWRILRDIPQFASMLDGVRHHHERIDGRGYPHGLKGEGIPLAARIIAIADTFDAMSSTRTYRAAKPRELVLAEMQACAGTQLDPQLVACFRAVDLSEYDSMNREHADGMKEAA
ncbi:MAG: Cyclic di-GMP phosphodiesterase response regulator RpfG [Planctomycetota bacterium]|jgi:HD-GYP domain-containing protein (c-di-GMP phosphodiesterase class II)